MKGLPLDLLHNLSILRKKEEDKNDNSSSEKFFLTPFLKQTLVALSPLLLTICSGMTVGYSAILLPQLQSLENSTLITDKEEASWIASMAALPMAVGSAFGGIFIEKMGRKTAHSISCIPTFIGWLLICLATGTRMILIGRFISGFFTGFLATATGVYIGEISDPLYRGFFLAGISTSISLGLFLSHLLGTFLSWQTTALTCSILPLFSQIIIFFVPESPSWLAGRGKTEEAEKSFYWCRGITEDSKKEFSIMLERQNQNQHSKMDKNSLKERLQELMVPEFLKPLGIITFYIVANQWAGINAITFYSVSVMKETIGSGLNEYVAMLIIDSLRLFMSIIACIMLRRFGRRPLALISGIGTFISLFSLTLYTFLIKLYPQGTSVYIPMTCLVFYILFVTSGFVPIPWTMMGEIFPLKHRSLGSGISSFAAFVAFFSVVKTAPAMFENFGPGGSFFTFGVVALVGTVFVYLFLPETKGRPLHEIEDGFKNKLTSRM